jgi:putative PIN family toxin of toxin-antitoxin system
MTELENKLLDKFKVPPTQARQARTLLETSMQIIDPPALDNPVCRDADDDWVLATALTGMCDCIVTGDDDLLVLKTLRDIAILNPTEFWHFESTRPPIR